jgi:hypothetical protein
VTPCHIDSGGWWTGLVTGKPEWVAYDTARLKLLNETPLAVWP